MVEKKDEPYSDAEAHRRFEAGLRRALNTPPIPAKEIAGKSERAILQREARARKAPRSKPKAP